jgi:hypothetical protein
MNNNADKNQGRGSGGRGNRGRGRGSGRGGRNLLAQRAIRQHELDGFVILVSRLDTGSRRELYNYVGSLLGETPSGPGDTGGNTGNPSPSLTNVPRPTRKTKVFERPIIKDLPGVAEFAGMTSAEKAQHSDINRLMSIATGTIARGRRLGLTDDEIRTRIFGTDQSADILRNLFVEAPPSEEEDATMKESSVAKASGASDEGGDDDNMDSSESGVTNKDSTAGSDLSTANNQLSIRNNSVTTPKNSWGSECESSDEEEQSPPRKRTKHSKKRKSSKKKHSSSKVVFPTDHNDKHSGKGPPPNGGGAGSAIPAA